MAYSPIAFVAPNYRDYKNWWLKAYEPGTTTPKTMSDNETGSPLSAKYEINKDGFIVSSGGALIVPFIDGYYDLYIFPTAAEADANDTAEALRVADNQVGISESQIGQFIGNYTNYEFNNVADMKSGTTIGGESVSLKAGGNVKTLGYYTAGDGGGATYLCIESGLFPGTPDELGDHTTTSGVIAAILDPHGIVWVEQYGARSGVDDESFSDALQAIIDKSGNPASITDANTFSIRMGRGTFWARRPAYIDALDGLSIIGSGLFTTTIKLSPSFTAGSGTVPPTFPSDGLDYATASWLVFARRRNTGKTGAFIVPGQAPGAGAAWYYEVSEFYFDSEPFGELKNTDVIRAPEIANLKMSKVVAHKVRHILHTDDNLGAYSSEFSQVQAWNSGEAWKVNRGTSMTFNQCGIIECDNGWTLRTNYSTYNSCTVDICGYGVYSWDIEGVGNVMNGCGTEFSRGGVFRALTRGTEITVNGGFLLGGISVGEPNYTGQSDEADFGIGVGEMILIDGAKVTFNRTVMRNITEANPGTIVHMNCTVKNGGRATIIGNTGEDFNEYVQPHEWIWAGSGVGGLTDRSRIDWVGESAQFEVYTTADEAIPQNGTRAVEFNNYEKTIDLGPSYFSTLYGCQPKVGSPFLQYVAPMGGVYNFTFQAFINNIDPGDYIYFLVTGQNNRIMVLSDFPNDTNIGNQITVSDKYFLQAGDTVTIFYRTFSTTVDPVILAGARFFGGICN